MTLPDPEELVEIRMTDRWSIPIDSEESASGFVHLEKPKPPKTVIDDASDETEEV